MPGRRRNPGSAGEPAEPVRSDEELRVDVEPVEAGRLRLRKVVEEEVAHRAVPRSVEHADLERVGAGEHDSGEIETLADGSISVPVFEEQLVVTKRLTVRERIVVRKQTVTEEHAVEATLRRERVEVDADDAVASRVTLAHGDDDAPAPAPPRRRTGPG